VQGETLLSSMMAMRHYYIWTSVATPQLHACYSLQQGHQRLHTCKSVPESSSKANTFRSARRALRLASLQHWLVCEAFASRLQAHRPQPRIGRSSHHAVRYAHCVGRGARIVHAYNVGARGHAQRRGRRAGHIALCRIVLPCTHTERHKLSALDTQPPCRSPLAHLCHTLHEPTLCGRRQRRDSALVTPSMSAFYQSSMTYHCA